MVPLCNCCGCIGNHIVHQSGMNSQIFYCLCIPGGVIKGVSNHQHHSVSFQFCWKLKSMSQWYSSVSTYVDLGTDLFLPCLQVWIYWETGYSAALAWADIIFAVSMSSVHMWALLLFAVANKFRTLEVWFLEFLNITFHFHVCIKNVTNSLATCRKIVMWIVFHT